MWVLQFILVNGFTFFLTQLNVTLKCIIRHRTHKDNHGPKSLGKKRRMCVAPQCSQAPSFEVCNKISIQTPYLGNSTSFTEK